MSALGVAMADCSNNDRAADLFRDVGPLAAPAWPTPLAPSHSPRPGCLFCNSSQAARCVGPIDARKETARQGQYLVG